MNYSSYFLYCYTAAPSPSYEVHPEKVINQDEMDALCPLDLQLVSVVSLWFVLLTLLVLSLSVSRF